MIRDPARMETPALGAVLALVLLAGCPRTAPEEGTGLVLPGGDPEAGLAVTSRMHCTDCHAFPGRDLPGELPGKTFGPPLGADTATRSRGYLATSLVDTHRDVDTWYAEMSAGERRSPMSDYDEELTVRQLIDLVEFLKSLGGAEAPGP